MPHASNADAVSRLTWICNADDQSCSMRTMKMIMLMMILMRVVVRCLVHVDLSSWQYDNNPLDDDHDKCCIDHDDDNDSRDEDVDD